MKIKIISIEFELIESSPGMWNRGAMGRSHYGDCKILLDENLPENVKMQTLMHEIVHMIYQMNDLPHMDEATISGLSNPLFDFLRQNPELVKRIAGI